MPTSTSSTAASAPSVVHGCPDSGLVPTPANIARVVAATLCLINKHRHAAGVASVHTNVNLGRAAAGFSQKMVSENFFNHVDPAGGTMLGRIQAVGYVKSGHGYTLGENIGAATGSDATPDAMVASWMASPEHKANILNPGFRDTGIGVVAAVPGIAGSGAGATYTQDFGSIT